MIGLNAWDLLLFLFFFFDAARKINFTIENWNGKA